MEIKTVRIGEDIYKLSFDDFDEEMDIDSLLKIDYSNLIGEIVTFPVIVNRFGVMLAEAESQVAESKLNLEIYEAKKKEAFRLKAVEEGSKAPTVEALNNALIADKGYQVLRRKYNEVIKTRDYINSAFWSAKDKSSKLDKLSLSIQPGDFAESVIEGKVNKVLIKKKNNLIK